MIYGDEELYREVIRIPKNKEDDTSIPTYFTGTIEWWDGHREFLVDGLVHRENGPAVTETDGTKSYWLKGIRVSPFVIFENLPKEEQEEIIWNLDYWVKTF